VLNAIISKFINNNCRLACVFIDFKKAFDFVYSNGLWFKLHKLGVRGRLLYGGIEVTWRNIQNTATITWPRSSYYVRTQ